MIPRQTLAKFSPMLNGVTALRNKKPEFVALLTVHIAMVTIMFVAPRVGQNPAYHNFADSRTVFGVANGLNVVCNLGFLVAGLLGLIYLAGSHSKSATAFLNHLERWPYVLFSWESF